MSMDIEFNINDFVEVKLTDKGYSVLRAYYKNDRSIEEGVIPETVFRYHYLGNDVFRLQLWEFMNIFGPTFYNGNNNRCVETTIVLKKS